MQSKTPQVFKVIHHKILVDFGSTNHFATRHALIQFELPKERLPCIYAQVHKAVTLAPLLLVIKDSLFSAFPRVLSPFYIFEDQVLKVKQAQRSLFDREPLWPRGIRIDRRFKESLQSTDHLHFG